MNNVTREVFWIFLHNMNIIPVPKRGMTSSEDTTTTTNPSEEPTTSEVSTNHIDQQSPTDLSQSYTKRHFPGSRPPVPAAPYIGGVEWDATTYMTTHLDLLNGLIASLPSTQARNTLRTDLQASGWEKVMGSTLRTCKEKFYSGVHDALRSWVAAAAEDGWNTRFVSQGPSRDEIVAQAMASVQASPNKKNAGGSPKKDALPPQLEAPRMELPKLSLGFGSGSSPGMAADGVMGIDGYGHGNGNRDGGGEAAGVKEDDGWLM